MKKTNTINRTMELKINDAQYKDVPIDLAWKIYEELKGYRVEPKAETPKETPKKTYAKAYKVAEDGKTIIVGGDGFIPTKVFKGITYSLKLKGAKYNPTTKGWTFDTKKACKEWTKEQNARA